MVMSIAWYDTLEQQFAECWSDENVDLALDANEKKIDLAVCALNLYLGWDTEQSFLQDMSRADEKDKDGNITSTFLDSLPLVGTEESENAQERQAQRATNKSFETYYVPKDDGKGMTKANFFDRAIRHLPKARVIVARLSAAKKLGDKNSSILLPENDPNHDLNGMTKLQLQTVAGYCTSQLNTLSSMARDAVGLYQQFKMFMDEWPDIRYEDDDRVGLRITENKGLTGEIARTKRPIVISDSAAQQAESQSFSVSQFLRIDVKLATMLKKRGTVSSLEAIKSTLRRETPEEKKPVIAKSNMSMDDNVKVAHIFYDNIINNVKGVDIRMTDPKRGEAMRRIYNKLYHELQAICETPEMNALWSRQREEEIAAASNVKTNDAPPVDQKIETPKEKNINKLRAAQQARKAS